MSRMPYPFKPCRRRLQGRRFPRLGDIVFLVSVGFGLAAQTQAKAQSEFDHFNTGFPLTGL